MDRFTEKFLCRDGFVCQRNGRMAEVRAKATRPELEPEDVRVALEKTRESPGVHSADRGAAGLECQMEIGMRQRFDLWRHRTHLPEHHPIVRYEVTQRSPRQTPRVTKLPFRGRPAQNSAG